jgi:hypothetical protein
MLKKYIQNNKVAVFFTGYVTSILASYLLTLYATVLKEDYEIQNRGIPFIYNIFNYGTLFVIIALVHLVGTLYFYKSNKFISLVSGIISLFFLILVVLPLFR